MTSLHDIRYGFEQIVLPGLFHETSYSFFTSIFNEPDRIYTIFSDLCKSQRFNNPYNKTQFRSRLVKINPNVIAYQVTFPTPLEPPLCHRAYFIIDSDCKNLKYYTAEKGLGNATFLCQRLPNGSHLNCGSAASIDEELAKIRNSYK